MLIVAALAAMIGYMLLYAGIKGVYWAAPWRLITSSVPKA